MPATKVEVGLCAESVSGENFCLNDEVVLGKWESQSVDVVDVDYERREINFFTRRSSIHSENDYSERRTFSLNIKRLYETESGNRRKVVKQINLSFNFSLDFN